MNNKITYARDKCTEETLSYRTTVETLLKEEQDVLATIQGDTDDAALKYIGLADSMLNLASHYIVMDGVAQALINQRNGEALNDARKTLYKSVIYLEKIVSNHIDAPYSDYSEKLDKIETVNPAVRFLLVRKMGLAIELLINAYGDNTKWKWAFVELEGRYAAVAKNLLNLRDIIVNSNFDSPHYEPTIRHLALAKHLLSQTADRYREKYELSANHIDDFQMAINFLSALRRLAIVTGDQVEAVNVKKKLDIWNVKLATDMEKQEKLEKLEELVKAK